MSGRSGGAFCGHGALRTLCYKGCKPQAAPAPERPFVRVSRPVFEANGPRVPMVFLRIEWMDEYSSQAEDWGRHMEWTKDNLPGEHRNWEPLEGAVYGWFRLQEDEDRATPRMRVERILNARLGWDSWGRHAEGVLVVWVAPRDGYGNVVVGWYHDANVYEHDGRLTAREFPHIFEERGWEAFRATAGADNAYLLKPGNRTHTIPTGRDGFGQNNIWYAETRPDIRAAVLEYINAAEKDATAFVEREET